MFDHEKYKLEQENKRLVWENKCLKQEVDRLKSNQQRRTLTEREIDNFARCG